VCTLHSYIWKGESWILFDIFGKFYNIFLYPFDRSKQSINKFLRKYPKIFKVTHKYVWNLADKISSVYDGHIYIIMFFW
jgi:hypothetical protein